MTGKNITTARQEAVTFFRNLAKQHGKSLRQMSNLFGLDGRYFDNCLSSDGDQVHNLILRLEHHIDIPADLVEWAESERKARGRRSRSGMPLTKVVSPEAAHYPTPHPQPRRYA